MFLNYIKEFAAKKILKNSLTKCKKQFNFWNNKNGRFSYRSAVFFRNKSFNHGVHC